jgi:arylsulfatase A-like enzyme
MYRRRMLTTIGLLLAAAAPNLIFVMTDDHAAHAISAYGSRVNQTPQLDRLAREGIVFRNAFVTNSICTPSRAVILTGLYSHKKGVPFSIASTARSRRWRSSFERPGITRA